ncbi:hypothetical protein V1277_002583 [Bradyrhizobium sp. AZCC 1588]|uniref:hypothetical protein n=1 Tax=unclassified Bradyrhizobium TaxID=2631580 RepID=UPI002FF0BBF5
MVIEMLLILMRDATGGATPTAPLILLAEHDPEKWTPVFSRDNAERVCAEIMLKSTSQSGMTIRRNIIPLGFTAW